MYDRLKPTNFSTPSYSKKIEKELYFKVNFSNFKEKQLFEKRKNIR